MAQWKEGGFQCTVWAEDVWTEQGCRELLCPGFCRFSVVPLCHSGVPWGCDAQAGTGSVLPAPYAHFSTNQWFLSVWQEQNKHIWKETQSQTYSAAGSCVWGVRSAWSWAHTLSWHHWGSFCLSPPNIAPLPVTRHRSSLFYFNSVFSRKVLSSVLPCESVHKLCSAGISWYYPSEC